MTIVRPLSGTFPPDDPNLNYNDGSDPELDRIYSLAASRVAIEAISLSIDGGRFAAKTVLNKPTPVEADIFCDGHDKIDAAIRFRAADDLDWRESPMLFVENDRWRGEVCFDALGAHEIQLIAWRDLFATWQAEVAKKHAAGVPIELELAEGRDLVCQALDALPDGSATDARSLQALADALAETTGIGERFALLMTGETTQLMRRNAPRVNLSESGSPLPVWVDRPLAAFSAWYELFPRSAANDENRHGTFDDVVERLPYIKDLGFDVVYFPPIHPIGTKNRKGRNNSLTPAPDDPGSPYAIGAAEGGHEAIHPELGDFDAFERLIEAATQQGLEVALDFAIQCSPDHPWIREHPEWFDWRPDGTIKYAENPPKKYEDIVNVHFYGASIPSLWLALRDVVLFWVRRGVKIFRVDNPHTKPYPFWEWMISDVRAAHPEVIFLAEAFTRPKVMKRLAKLGFTQSYSYFTWRNTKQELATYLEELSSGDMQLVMRPNFFVNTPDINPVPLQTSGRAGFRTRAILAGSLSPSWGLYSGFELCEAVPLPGREEYLDSEKYQLRARDFDAPGHIKADIRLINNIRNAHPALHAIEGVRFYQAWNDHILYYARMTPDMSDFVLFAVNLDPHRPQGADIEIPLWEFGLPDDAGIEGVDLVTGNRFRWQGKMQNVWLTPDDRPYAIWSLHSPAVEIRGGI